MKIAEMTGSRMEIFRGKQGERALLVRQITAEDVPAVMELQDYVMACLPDQNLLVGDTQEEYLESAEQDFSIGIFDGPRLAGFSQMVVNRDTPRSLGKKLGYPPEKCVYIEISFVHPDYRGLGIQSYALRRREEIARALGAELAFVTVSPDNPHSLNNILAGGYEIIERRVMYSGVDRYILMKRL